MRANDTVLHGGFTSELESAIGLVKSLTSGSGPGVTEVSSFSLFLRKSLERCALWCLTVNGPGEAKDVKKYVKCAKEGKFLVGRQAACVMYERLAQEVSSESQPGLKDLDGLYKYRWLVFPLQQQQLQKWKEAAVNMPTAHILQARALKHKAEFPEVAPAPASASAASAPASASDSISAGDLQHTPLKAKQDKQAVNKESQPLLRFSRRLSLIQTMLID